MSDTPNLPAIHQFPMHPITPDTAFPEVQAVDVKMVDYVFHNIGRGWSMADTIDDIAKMSMLTFKAIEKRRDVLLYPNAYKSDKTEGFIVMPIP